MVSGFGTRAIHSAQRPDPTTGAVIPALSLSTTYKQSAAGVHTVSKKKIKYKIKKKNKGY